MGTSSLLGAASTGAIAGLGGTAVQTAVGLAFDKLLLPKGQDSNIAPRLMNRLFRITGHGRDRARDWTVGMLFHTAYGAGVGVAYGLARRATGMPPALLAPAFAGLIYLSAFSRVGGGTLTLTERPPGWRSRRKQASLVAIPFAYAVATAALFSALQRGSPQPQQLPAAR